MRKNETLSGGVNHKHMPALDGLRGWAVLAVMFYHFALPLTQTDGGGRAWWITLKLALTGSYGVDMFFVLSGFLITGILLDTKTSPQYFRTFYMRRVVRIFPLYYGVLAVCFGLLFWMPIMKQFIAHQGWLWLYTANFSELTGVSFEPMFSHFWSLAIEEQFYMVWPLVVLLLSRHSLMTLAAALAIMSPILRCTLIGTGMLNAELAANLTPCRLDGLAMGALIAGISRSDVGLAPFRNWALLLAIVGGVGTLVLKALYGSSSNSIWGLSGIGHFLMCAAAAGIMTLALARNGFWCKILSWQWLRFFGKYSYGLYVFHYLIQPWMDSRFWYFESIPVLSLVIHLLAMTGLTVLVALASWHAWEKQFLKFKRRFEYKQADSATDALPNRVHVLGSAHGGPVGA